MIVAPGTPAAARNPVEAPQVAAVLTARREYPEPLEEAVTTDSELVLTDISKRDHGFRPTTVGGR
ncbi:hypothetical protein GCM10023323_72180 [Streptomyces thinghirensis]|uniref:Uncharacterized protein n=1 Tax=Streptomyces thinghirensis TaxID=551547 RepID=A0ABP9TDN2_9ACTN